MIVRDSNFLLSAESLFLSLLYGKVKRILWLCVCMFVCVCVAASFIPLVLRALWTPGLLQYVYKARKQQPRKETLKKKIYAIFCFNLFPQRWNFECTLTVCVSCRICRPPPRPSALSASAPCSYSSFSGLPVNKKGRGEGGECRRRRPNLI